MAFYMLFQWSGAMKNGSMSYFCKWVLDNTFFGTADAWVPPQGLLSIMGAIPMAVAAVFVVPLANKFGKRLVCGGFMLLVPRAASSQVWAAATSCRSPSAWPRVWVLPRPAI